MRKFYKLFFPAIIMLILHLPGFSQPIIEWQKTYGGSYIECNSFVIPTTDDGYLIAGSSNSNDIDVSGNHGGFDFWVLQTDAAGEITWQKSYGGSLNEGAQRTIQTSDGGFVIVGYSESTDGNLTGNHGLKDMWILKVKADNSIAWQKNIGGSADDEAADIIEATDGSYIILGNTASTDGDIQQNKGFTDYWILNIDTAGTLLWQKTFGGSSDDIASSVLQTDDGGFILAGSSFSTDGDIVNHYYTNNYSDYFIIKLDAQGNKEWVKNYGGNATDNLTQILKTNDGGYMLCGFSDSDNGDVTGNHGSIDTWVIKISSTGGIQWQKSVGGSADDMAFSIAQRTDGDYVLCGNTASNDGMVSGHYGVKDIWVVRLNASGPLVWQKCFGGSLLDESYSMQLLDDESCVISGYSGSSDYDLTSNHGDLDLWFLKLSNLSALEDFKFNGSQLFSIYPNPVSSGNVTVKINDIANASFTADIIDITGRKLFTEIISGNTPATIDISYLSKGMYYIRLNGETLEATEKIIIQ
jgi:hypothetical protein